MAESRPPRVVALEEHYYDAELAATFDGPEGRAPETRRRLFDLGELRLAEMDAAGIDVQVLSHGAPSVQRLDAETAVWMARGANDRLAEAIARHPDRFAGFAALPTPDPESAAAELDRAVTALGFKGAMVHGLTNGVFLDDRRFWPIFERAQALDVPLYIHPAVPDPAVVEAYYRDYLQEFPSLLTAAWGFTVETATQAIRLVLSGAFEAYPEPEDHPGAHGRGAAVPALAARSCALATRQPPDLVPRAVQPSRLDHHQRQLLHPGPALLDAGAGRRSDHVLGGLAVRAEPAGDGLAPVAPDLGRG